MDYAAGHDDFRVFRLDRLCSQCHGLQTRSADLVDGHRGHARVKPAFQPRLSRRILTQPGGEDIAHDDLVHLCRLDSSPAYHLPDHNRAQIDSGKG